MASDIPGVTNSQGNRMAEYAVSCLVRAGHSSGVQMECVGIKDGREPLFWRIPFSPQLDRSTADTQEAIEHGAEWISILYAIENTKYSILERSWKGTGFDYWLKEKSSPLFQGAARLEISGVFNGSSQAKRRVNKKIKQTNRSDGMNLPAYISVVEFGCPSIYFVEK